ncbi:MAG: hypothetical protein KJ046_13070 [Anaerolineae bacterium]|nr:hypothetical protein [Anaerolineae bacterium]
MTGLSDGVFDRLADEILSQLAEGGRQRLNQEHPLRQREPGGGRNPTLSMVKRL